MRTSFTAGCCLLALAAAAPGETQTPDRRPTCQILVTQPGARLSPANRPNLPISAAVTDDVTVAVMLPPTLSGDHILTLHITTPGGHLYQSMTVPISDSPRLVEVHGYPRPLPSQAPVQTMFENVPRARVQVAFPVGGTSISTNSIYGVWQIVPYLDGAEKPCGPAYAMEIKP